MREGPGSIFAYLIPLVIAVALVLLAFVFIAHSSLILPFLFVALVFSVIIILVKFRISKGNVADYDIKNFKLIWKDSLGQHNSKAPKSRKELFRKIKVSCVMFLLSIFVILIVSLIDNPITSVEEITLMAEILVLVFVVSILLAIYSLLSMVGWTISYKIRKAKVFPEEELYVYREGLKCFNYFIPWEDVKSINYSKSHKASKVLGKILAPVFAGDSDYSGFSSASGAGGPTSTLRISDKKGEIYFVEVLDKKGLFEALENLGQKFK